MSISSLDFLQRGEISLDEKDFAKYVECLELCKRIEGVVFEWLILVNVTTQRLYVLTHLGYKIYDISTSKKGVGQENNSGQTPLGLHQIQEKIGEGSDPLAIFKSRVNTGNLAIIDGEDEAIVGRIFRLGGLQVGFNFGINSEGKVVDTHDRYIYIHGTNDVKNIGKPASSGCVRMKPNDAVELFSAVPEMTPVYIYET